MIGYIVRRVIISAGLLVVASFVCFALVQLLGDPIAGWAEGQRQRNPAGAEAAIAEAYRRAGLHDPFPQRYGDWLTGFIAGDWGTTVNPGRSPEDVQQRIWQSAWITIRLVLVATGLSIVVGTALGVITATRRNSPFDHAVTGFSFLVFSMPIFCVAVLLKIGGIWFNDQLQAAGFDRWLVTAGYPPGGFRGTVVEQASQYSGVYLLPTLSLVIISFAAYTRFQRAAMLDAIGSDYVRAARAKGLSGRRVIWVHAFRNALIPVLTISSLNLGALVSGAVITETVFGWQGMGWLLVTYVERREPYMILAFLMVTAVFVILFNLIADISYTLLDPRIHLD